jgi:hypothetical protein
MNKEIMSDVLYLKIAELLQSARQAVVRNVNQAMVYTYFKIGRVIVEDEQQGKERAKYGKKFINRKGARRFTQRNARKKLCETLRITLCNSAVKSLLIAKER